MPAPSLSSWRPTLHPVRRGRALFAGVPFGVVLLAAIVGASIGAGPVVAQAADNAHVTCVYHGFVAGASDNDGSYFARVNPGCGSSSRSCSIVSGGTIRGTQYVNDTTSICSIWSRDVGAGAECSSGAYVTDPGVFGGHEHDAIC